MYTLLEALWWTNSLFLGIYRQLYAWSIGTCKLRDFLFILRYYSTFIHHECYLYYYKKISYTFSLFLKIIFTKITYKNLEKLNFLDVGYVFLLNIKFDAGKVEIISNKKYQNKVDGKNMRTTTIKKRFNLVNGKHMRT